MSKQASHQTFQPPDTVPVNIFEWDGEQWTVVSGQMIRGQIRYNGEVRAYRALSRAAPPRPVRHLAEAISASKREFDVIVGPWAEIQAAVRGKLEPDLLCRVRLLELDHAPLPGAVFG